VQLDIFYDISNRVMEFLKMKRCVGENVGPRSVELMRPYMRQLVYKTAIHCAFDMPFSENFKRKFSTQHIAAIQPYLYATTSMVWWVWTTYAGAFISDDFSNVIRAMIKAANVEWNEGDTPYDVFQYDIFKRMPWRTHRNRSHGKDDPPGDKELLDLQYLRLEGTLDQVCVQISERTNPHLSPNDVKGVLARLEKRTVPLPRGGYKLQPRQTFEKWHMFTELPSEHNGHRGVKHLGEACPMDYISDDARRSPAEHMRTEDDVPAIGDDASKPAVDMCDLQRHQVLYFIPYAQDMFHQDIIKEALLACTLCGTTRPGKILLATSDHNDSTRLGVHAMSAEDIEEALVIMDQDDGYQYTLHGGLKYTGPLPEGERPVSRREGLVFNRRGALDKSEFNFTAPTFIAPVSDGDEEATRARYDDEMEAMSQTHEIVRDLDEESARRQHMACGRPLDEPVRSPKWIEEQYKRHMQRGEGDTDYPFDLATLRAKMERSWSAAGASIVQKHQSLRALLDRTKAASANTRYNKPPN